MFSVHRGSQAPLLSLVAPSSESVFPLRQRQGKRAVLISLVRRRLGEAFSQYDVVQLCRWRAGEVWRMQCCSHPWQVGQQMSCCASYAHARIEDLLQAVVARITARTWYRPTGAILCRRTLTLARLFYRVPL